MAAGGVRIITSTGEEEVLRQRHLPDDLMTDHILTRLPIKSLLRFKSVSKTWYSTLSSHKFVTAHFKLSPFSHPSFPTQCIFIHSGLFFNLFYYHDDDDEEIDAYYGKKGLIRLGVNFDVLGNDFRVVGSCNGLVCLASMSGYFIIWNPISRQWRKITGPLPLKSSRKPQWVLYWGFGYVSSVDDYKVVQIIKKSDPLDMFAYVYSLRSNKWREINDDDDDDDPDDVGFHDVYVSQRGVLVDETVYWKVGMRGEPVKFFAFDLVLESFVPNNLFTGWTHYRSYMCLCVIGGCLAKYESLRDEPRITMLKYPGQEESIHLSRDLNLSVCQNLVGFTRTRKFFILHRLGELGLVDPSSCPMEYTKLATFGHMVEDYIVNHVPNLISPLNFVELQEE